MIETQVTLREVTETYDTDGRLSRIVITAGRPHRDPHTIGFDCGYEDSLFLDAGEIHMRYHDTPAHLPVAADAVELATQVRAFAREIAEHRRTGEGLTATSTPVEISPRLATSHELVDADGT